MAPVGPGAPGNRGEEGLLPVTLIVKSDACLVPPPSTFLMIGSYSRSPKDFLHQFSELLIVNGTSLCLSCRYSSLAIANSGLSIVSILSSFQLLYIDQDLVKLWYQMKSQ